MQRSEINMLMRQAENFLEKCNFYIPPWAFWSIEKWKKNQSACREIFDNMLGWDVTDFGSQNFFRRGLLLFTIRNGNFKKNEKRYAEKIMIIEENQETPLHFHEKKMEDIINRGGGNLVMELFRSTSGKKLAKQKIKVAIDGVKRCFSPGEKIILTPGESITLKPSIYHRFYAEKRAGRVLAGEVSTVNDDKNDNFFYEKTGRFPEITEDEQPLYFLISDYNSLHSAKHEKKN
ncbi:MAG TPA: D-lyxose/D-mannose family sugar isomerase [Spirochaetia bacterium]|nr:D-lyxose/D-mannose family sugar isomerase [Spirochaetia bacterium]